MKTKREEYKWVSGRLPDGKETRSLKRYLCAWRKLLNGLKELDIEVRGFDPGLAVTYHGYCMTFSVQFAQMLVDLNTALKETSEELIDARMDARRLQRGYDRE